jgi:hypothetical protein
VHAGWILDCPLLSKLEAAANIFPNLPTKASVVCVGEILPVDQDPMPSFPRL